MQPSRGTEILLEISLRIGASLNLEEMLWDTVTEMLRLLECSAAQVLRAKADIADGALHWQPLVTLPESSSQTPVLLPSVQRIGLPTDVKEWDGWAQRLPLVQEEESKTTLLVDLSGFGVIALERSGSPWDDEFIRSLTILFKKLAHACTACTATAENERRQKELETRNTSLSMIAQGRPLSEVLAALCRFTEEMDENIRSSILLYDPQHNQLFPAAAPSLPEDYNAILAYGVSVGPRVGSCGTAAYTRKLTIAADIQNDPCWQPHAQYLEKAREHDLKACWSMPIISSAGEVLGTLANYHRHVGGPSPDHLRFAAWAVDIAALAIEGQAAKESLQHSESKNRALLNAIPDMMFVIDREGYFIDYSCSQLDPNLLEAPDKFLGKHLRDVLPEALATLTMEVMERLIATKQIQLFEYPLDFPDGTRWFEGRAVLIGSDLMLTIVRDITDRKEAVENLRRSEQRFKELLQNVATVAVQGYALDGTIRYWNRASETFYGYTAEEAIGRNMLDLGFVPEALHEELLADLRRLAEKGELPAAYEIKLRQKDGTLIPVYSSYALVQVPGQEAEFFCIDVDLREQKRVEAEREQLQQQFAQAQKMESVGRLAGGVAHDFNNMLMVILGEAGLALKQPDLSERLQDGLHQITKAAERSAGLIRQLLAFARKQPVEPRVLNLNETIPGIMKMLRRLIGEHIELDWCPSAHVPPIFIDPSQVDQILTNLCVNARDAITGAGSIKIETQYVSFDEPVTGPQDTIPPGQYVLLSVSDTGCGLPEDTELRNHLFDPFFTTKKTGQGTGLGLSTIYGIVKQNEGFIEVESELGKGSAFRIYLPAREVQEIPQSKMNTPRVQTSEIPLTILLVEDEPDILLTTTRILEGMGHNVMPAATPALALKLAREQNGKIDLLITDVIMPAMNGCELAKQLIAEYPGIKSLFMSGHTADIIATHGVLEEGIHFIEKPFSFQQFADKIREVLADQAESES